MIVKGRVEDIGKLERILMQHLGWTRGVYLRHDGSKKFNLFNKDGLQSQRYIKGYLVSLQKGKPIIFSEWIKVEFTFDHRTGLAQMEIPRNRVNQLLDRMPELIPGISSSATGENGNIPIVDIQRLDNKCCEMVITCPRCKKPIEHKCYEVKVDNESHNED